MTKKLAPVRDAEKNELISGKTALKIWNRISAVLEENGVEKSGDLGRDIVTRLIEDDLIDGEFFVPGENHKYTVKVKRLVDEAVLPKFASYGDAGADLYSVESVVVPARGRQPVGTGIAIELPAGKVGLVHPRSGLAFKEGITVLNTPGTVDSGYRGEVKVILFNTTDTDFQVNVGDRIAQLVIQDYDHVNYREVDELSESVRGVGGFGSTGRS